MKVKLIVDGGSMKPGPAVSQQLGPMGINLGKVIEDVNEATKSFSGMKVPVELDVDTNTKEFTVSVSSPPVSELIKQEIKVEKGSGEAGTVKIGNIAIERVIEIAKTKMPDLLARDLKAAVKTVCGTCVSLGVLVDNKEAKEVVAEIKEGKYDSEIESEKTEVSEEKKQKLEHFFTVRKAKQDKDKKAEEEAKAAEEAAKAEAEAAAPAEGEGETTEGEAEPGAEAAKEEKKE